MIRMTGVPFFMKNQVRAWLTSNASNEDAFYFVHGDDFVIELIDRPYRCTFMAGDGVVVVKLYIRSELGMYDEKRGDLNLTACSDGSEPVIWGSDRIENGETIILDLLQAGNQLCNLFAASERVPDCSDMNPEHEGIVVKRAEDTLCYRRVAGKRRPALLCTTLFGGDQPVRPYADEIRNAWKQTEKDFQTLLQEAEEGDEEAMECVARRYLKGDAEVDVVPERAAHWFLKLAEADDAVGQFQLAMLYLRGMGVEKNVARALYWMQRAEENDHAEAGTYAQACARILTLQEQADAGDDWISAKLAEEYLALGREMEDGDDFFTLSFRLAEKAAVQDIPEAMWVLAQIYEYGLGVPEDTERAVAYYQRGCALGHAGCMHSLGCFYLQGDYLISDVDQGVKLCLRAAEQGYGPAMLTIGNCYQFGDGVPSSMQLAVAWYEKYLETKDDPEVRHMVMHYRSISGLANDAGMEVPFEMLPEQEPFSGFSIFGDDPFTSGMFESTMDFGGGGMFGMDQGLFSETSTFASSVPMFSDDLIWTRLRAEAGDQSAITLLAALEGDSDGDVLAMTAHDE